MARENHLHNVTRPPKEEGIVLILVMLLILILSVSSMAFLLMGSYEGDLVREWVESNEAFYLAETGIEQALWRLRDEEEGDWDWENWPPPTHPDWLDSSGGNGEDFWLLWNGTLGDGKNYQVQLEKGIIQSKIVSTGSVTFDRVIQLEVASAFDYGLFSHGQTEFQNDEFTVTGINNNGYVYVYSDDGTNPITDPSSLLVADKVTGNFQDGPGNFLYLPQEISLPELWKAKFKAHIDDNPSPTTVMYDNDSGEQNLEAGALLHNKTRGNSRIIQSFTIDTNII
ncbi:MAG: hypothetical protein SVW57_12630, partial [Thermodesulfobacteriota bacterium]|nr:hypothetical protein [Thermodesulfobacteriota bacterium]